MKAGFDLQDYHFDGFSFSRYGGTFRFRNVQEFLTLQRSATAQADRFTGNLPGTDTFREMRQKYAAFFVQDDWRASRSPEHPGRPALRLRDRPEGAEWQGRRAAAASTI